MMGIRNVSAPEIKYGGGAAMKTVPDFYHMGSAVADTATCPTGLQVHMIFYGALTGRPKGRGASLPVTLERHLSQARGCGQTCPS